jgi:hypothetical protein
MSNYAEWHRAYAPIFREKYVEFCNLFPSDQKPSYANFVAFIWVNTHKYVNPRTKKIYARVDNH